MNNFYYLYRYPNAYVRACSCSNMRSWPSYNEPFQPYVDHMSYTQPRLKDHGNEPFVVDINEAAEQNDSFRTAIWTGNHLQVTLMSIDVGDSIGLEMHPHVDQFLRIEEGDALVEMGKSKDELDFVTYVDDDWAIIVPAGTWHNVTNTGNVPLKLYSIYAPPNHPFGTIHQTKAEAMAAEY